LRSDDRIGESGRRWMDMADSSACTLPLLLSNDGSTCEFKNLKSPPSGGNEVD
jgi:hypothetical protein